MKFLMDYDNIPGKGPKMLFKENGDGTLSLATPEDVETAIKEALDAKDKLQTESEVRYEAKIGEEKDRSAVHYGEAISQLKSEHQKREDFFSAVTNQNFDLKKEIQDLQSQVEKLIASRDSALKGEHENFEEITKQKAEIEALKKELQHTQPVSTKDYQNLRDKLSLYHSAILKAKETLVECQHYISNSLFEGSAIQYEKNIQVIHDLNELGEKP